MSIVRRSAGLRWVLFAIVGISAGTLFVVINTGFGSSADNEPLVSEDQANYAVFATSLPEELSFAAEEVPLQFFDVRESLDRELISNTYFHSQTIRYIKLSSRYFPVIEPILDSFDIPNDFKYLAIAESGLENVVSPAGATGFWQIAKGTGLDYGLEINNEVDERYHLEKSTEAACDYLRESYEKYGNWTMAAASYNAGRRGMDRQITRQKEQSYYDLLLNDETARYLYRVLAFKLILEDPSAYGFKLSNRDLYQEIPYKLVEVTGGVPDFADFAKEHDTNYKMLKRLNPWLRDNKLTNSKGHTYQIKIPVDRQLDGEL